MKKVNNYWVDDGNNFWNCELYPKDDAEKYSRSLINCNDCIDCCNCNNCNRGVSCIDCKKCNACYDCNACNDCDGCLGCINCKGLWSCSFCHDYIRNPECISTSIENNAPTMVYWVQKDIQVVSGLFRGDLVLFEAHVKNDYKLNNKFRNEYLDFIKKVKAYMS